MRLLSSSNLLVVLLILSALLLYGCGEKQAPETKTATKTEAVAKTSQEPAAASQPATQPPNASAAEKVSVTIKGFAFSPKDLNIKVGTTVTWTNEDSAPHTVESSDGTLRSDELSKGDTFTFTFTKPGRHDYICGIHTSMKGSITVT